MIPEFKKKRQFRDQVHQIPHYMFPLLFNEISTQSSESTTKEVN